MNIPKEIKWGFDPHASNIAALKTRTGRLVWGVIRTNHIVDQHFNDHVEAFVNAYHLNEKAMFGQISEFIKLASLHELDVFGTVPPKHGAGFGVPDLEWWGELRELLNSHREIKEYMPLPG